jgi:hypothetical protein
MKKMCLVFALAAVALGGCSLRLRGREAIGLTPEGRWDFRSSGCVLTNQPP